MFVWVWRVWKGAELWVTVASTFHLAKLQPSQLRVLWLHDYANPANIGIKLVALFESSGLPLSAADVSRQLHLSLPLADQMLLQAERTGALCRDAGNLDGVRFWKNIFV